jgi:bacterial leucyl aminopeptidase
MIRMLICICTLVSALSVEAAVLGNRFYLVPTSHLDFFKLEDRPTIESSQSGLSLVQLSPFQVEEFSEQAHKRRNVCGGFTDAQVQMEKRGLSPDEALTWALSRPNRVHLFTQTTTSYPTQVEKLMGLTSESRFGSFLKELTSFPDRSATSDLGTKASQWLATRAGEMAQSHSRSDITIITIPTRMGYKQNSVLVKVPGHDLKLPAILIGGHMDTFSDNKPGADDDGTGVATVMEIYNALLDSGMSFQRTIYFAFYSAEERGLYGSQAMAADFQTKKIEMKAILQYDMTGFKSPKDTQELYFVTDHVDTGLTTFLKILTETYLKIPAQLIGETECGYACSDHASWTNAGYSSVFPFEASFENYNKTLHTSKDTMELITPAHVMKFVKLGAAFAVELAEPQ